MLALVVVNVNLHTKCKCCPYSADMTGTLKIKNQLCDPDHTHFRPGFPVVDVCTKFEISINSHYEDTKGGAKCRKWVVCGSYGLWSHSRLLHCF